MQINEFVQGIFATTGIGGLGYLAWKKLWNTTTRTDAETDIIQQQNNAIASLTARVDELFNINVNLQNQYFKQEVDCRARDNALQDEIRILKIAVEGFQQRENFIKSEQELRASGQLKTRKTDK